MSAPAASDLLRQHTELLFASVGGLDDAALRAPSRCAGWTRGHVVTHLARNAEALSRVVDALVDGAEVTMYASDAARDRAIEEGAGRPPAEQLDDVQQTAAALHAQLPRLLPEHAGLTVPRTPGSARQVVGGDVVLLRLNEVVLHHIDLDLTFSFGDVDDPTVELLSSLAGVGDAPDAGAFVLPDGTRVRGDRRDILAYVTRQHADGVTIDEREQR